ncbi:MAG: hypothetical protein ABIJ10_06540, partial [Candidatus Micrarchaeota archaeon]|nr:hypothetical protein [Candidatus Micrarchaeota archaeon]MBU1886486.1 hypothetical protein [Candidatus Micrarchaeota archaeon]
AAAKEEPGRLKKFGNLLLEGIRGLGTGTRKLLVYGAVATTLGLTACPKPSEQPDGQVSDGDSDVDSDIDSDVDNDGDMDSDIPDMEQAEDTETDIDDDEDVDDDVDFEDSMECVETTECDPELDVGVCNIEGQVVEGWMSMAEPLCSDLLPVRFVMTSFDPFRYSITDECGVPLIENRPWSSEEMVPVGENAYQIDVFERDNENQSKRVGITLNCFGGAVCCITNGSIEHGEGYPSQRLGFDNVYITIDTVDETGDRHIARLEVYDRTTDALITRLNLGNGEHTVFEDADGNRYLLDGSRISMGTMAGIPVARATLDVYSVPRSGCGCYCDCAE